MASDDVSDVCDEILAGFFPHIDDEYSTYIKGSSIQHMQQLE